MSISIIEQINRNIAISTFMGLTVKDGFLGQEHGGWCSSGELKYHNNWNWLMPVVEKISKMPLLNVDNTPCTDYNDTCYPRTFGMPTGDGKVMVRFNGFSLHTAVNLIEAVYAAVYEVAEWHIQNQSK